MSWKIAQIAGPVRWIALLDDQITATCLLPEMDLYPLAQVFASVGFREKDAGASLPISELKKTLARASSRIG